MEFGINVNCSFTRVLKNACFAQSLSQHRQRSTDSYWCVAAYQFAGMYTHYVSVYRYYYENAIGLPFINQILQKWSLLWYMYFFTTTKQLYWLETGFLELVMEI